MQSIENFNRDLLAFLQASPTPFHAATEMGRRFADAGFTQLDEAKHWQLQGGKSYYVIRNDSSIIAFSLSDKSPVDSGFRMVGAHTDSPCLKVKPNPEISSNGYFQLGVEVYGGALLNPWFDRDLSLAGKVVFKNSSGAMGAALINFVNPIATIPSLAIHLDRDANKGRTVNPQTDIVPVLMMGASSNNKTDDAVNSDPEFRTLLLAQLQKEWPEQNADTLLDYELSFYDTQSAALVGVNEDYIASARLDNLLSCYIGMQSLLDCDSDENCLLVCNDHEEVGSMSASGAQGPMLSSLLHRVVGSSHEFSRAMSRSMMISADNAHGIHPNFSAKHDANHGPLLNAGPVLKVNANQRYATNSETSSIFRHVCELAQEPVQTFVTRTDMACGSTIGPITASELGVKTLDVGVPTFAMHSIRELAGSRDAYSLYRILMRFNECESVSLA